MSGTQSWECHQRRCAKDDGDDDDDEYKSDSRPRDDAEMSKQKRDEKNMTNNISLLPCLTAFTQYLLFFICFSELANFLWIDRLNHFPDSSPCSSVLFSFTRFIIRMKPGSELRCLLGWTNKVKVFPPCLTRLETYFLSSLQAWSLSTLPLHDYLSVIPFPLLTSLFVFYC
jgi:hypothetical protein